jgi:putative ABC transport system ATP-binding protein
MAPVIRIRRLVFNWDATPCLDIAAFDLAAGERIFLYGPSGSGKSTLLNLLAGVLTPCSGTLEILGQPLQTLPGASRDRFRADHIGFIFQQFNLIPYLSALENVLLPCHFSVRRRERAGYAQETAARLLLALDLDKSLWNRPATALSVGQQQRVAAARALIGAPELVIADEPTSALDAERQRAFLDLLMQECDAHGAALVFVSHDRRLSAGFSRVLDMATLHHHRENAS